MLPLGMRGNVSSHDTSCIVLHLRSQATSNPDIITSRICCQSHLILYTEHRHSNVSCQYANNA